MSRRSSTGRPMAVAGLLAGAALVGTACQVDINTGGQSVTRTFDIADFEHLEIDSSFDVDVEVGEAASLTIEIGEEIVDRLQVDQDGDRLTIGFDGGLLSTSSDMNITVTTPSLASVDFDGAVSADIEGLDEARLEVDLNGASQVDGRGSVGVLVIDADGASSIDFSGVEIDRVEIEADGASSIDVTEAGEVSGRAAGASSIEVSEETTVDVRTSGAASVSD
ncbi:MAG: DUF2807 domain-containing protein [Actinomycetota bacterium]